MKMSTAYIREMWCSGSAHHLEDLCGVSLLGLPGNKYSEGYQLNSAQTLLQRRAQAWNCESSVSGFGSLSNFRQTPHFQHNLFCISPFTRSSLLASTSSYELFRREGPQPPPQIHLHTDIHIHALLDHRKRLQEDQRGTCNEQAVYSILS